jgi:uncharacterized protein (TIGR02599 family)
MVSSVIVVMILGFLFVTVDQTVGQFQAARIAFDSLSRNLSQATLNTYWDLDMRNGNPVNYRRQSDLHFVIDKAYKLFTAGDAGKYPTDAVFFQAPLGFTAEEAVVGQRKYRALNNLLSVVGYYIEWDEEKNMPDFLTSNEALSQKRYRYRLMEVIQPAEMNMVYNNTNYTFSDRVTGIPQSPYKDSRDWVRVALGQLPLPGGLPLQASGKPISSARVLGENVIALIIIPKKAEKDRSSADALDDIIGIPGKETMYDSRPQVAFLAQERPRSTAVYHDVTRTISAKERLQLHQLPPILQVTMVAIDEDSGARLEAHSTTPPSWTSGLFQKYSTVPLFAKEMGDVPEPEKTSLIYKLANPEKTLPTPRVNYRVFSTDIVMRGSKWTNYPK